MLEGKSTADNDFDSDVLYNVLSNLDIDQFINDDLKDLEILLLMILRLLNYQDLSIRTTVVEKYEQFFNSFSQNKLNTKLID